MDYLSWQYDESKHVGKDYGNPIEAEQYDSRHAQFRNVERDSERILDALGLRANGVVIDLGAGTGTYSRPPPPTGREK